MGNLILGLFQLIALHIVQQAGTHVVDEQDGVDLIEGQPVFDLALVTGDNGANVPLPVLHHLWILPPALVLDQVQGRVIVIHGHHGFNPVFCQFVEHLVVKFQPLFVGLQLIALGENAGPCNGHPETLQPQLGQQRNVFLVPVVKINAIPLGVHPIPFFLVCRFQNLTGHGPLFFQLGPLVLGTVGFHVANRQASAPSCQAPSHWQAAVAPPHKKSFGMDFILPFSFHFASWCSVSAFSIRGPLSKSHSSFFRFVRKKY